MNKIRVIDLLNKIANNEELPEKIKYKNRIYFRSWSDYMGDEPIDEYYVDSEENSWNDALCLKLDDEVEVLEEDKEIAKIDFRTLNTQKEKNRVMKDTINQLIDELNELKKGK